MRVHPPVMVLMGNRETLQKTKMGEGSFKHSSMQVLRLVGGFLSVNVPQKTNWAQMKFSTASLNTARPSWW